MIKYGIVIVFLMFSLVGVSYFLFIGIPGDPMTLEEAKTMVSKEVALGSNRFQVEAWLKEKHLEYSYIEGKQNLEFNSAIENSGYKPSQLSGYIAALVRDTRRSFLTQWSIHITFFFDKKGRLIDYSIQEIGTGP